MPSRYSEVHDARTILMPRRWASMLCWLHSAADAAADAMRCRVARARRLQIYR